MGGLYRYLNLIYVPEIYIQQVHVTTGVTGDDSGNDHLEIDFSASAINDVSVKVKSTSGELVYEKQLSCSSTKLEHDFQLAAITRASIIKYIGFTSKLEAHLLSRN